MLLFRAINEEQLSYIKEGEMLSSLLISYDRNLVNNIKQVKENYNNSIGKSKNIFYQLSFIIGHTSGKLLEACRSPWISVTKKFEIALEYAMLRKCQYKQTDIRAIVCFEIEDAKIVEYNENLTINDLECINNGHVLDLSNGNLNNFFKSGLIPTITECKELSQTNKKHASLKKTELVQSNYSYYDNELLIFGKIILDDFLIIKPEEIIAIDNNETLKEWINQTKSLEKLKAIYETTVKKQSKKLTRKQIY